MLYGKRWITFSIIIFLVVVIAPIVWLILNTFWDQGHFSLQFIDFLRLNGRQIDLLKTSIFLAITATCLSLLLAIPYAVFLERVFLPCKSFFAVAYLIPILIPSYIQAIVWDSLFSAIEKIFFVSPFWSAALCLALSYFPYITILVVGGLQGIDHGCEEIGLLNRGKWPSLLYVTLPMVAPHIITGSLFVFIFSIIDFGVPDIFRLRVYPVEIFIQFSGLYNEKAAILLAFPLLIVMAFLILLQVLFMKRKCYIGFSHAFNKNIFWFSWQARSIATTFVVFVLLLSTATPIIILIKKVGSFDIFFRILIDSSGDLFYSIILAFLASLIMTILAFWIAYFLERISSKKQKLLWEYLTQLPFSIPSILLGIALIKLWNQPFSAWLYQTPLMIIIGYVAHYIPFPIRTLSSSLKQIDIHLEEVASLTTQNNFRITSKIILPLIRKGLFAAFFIGFVLSLSDLGVTLLIIPPGLSTIPVESYNFMHYGAEDKVAALCLILIMIQFIFAASIWRLSQTTSPVCDS